jgi:hypothetical protein
MRTVDYKETLFNIFFTYIAQPDRQQYGVTDPKSFIRNLI